MILIFAPNYYLYMVIVIGMQIISNFIYAGVSIKTFPKYKPYGILPMEEVKAINRRVMDLFTSKVGAVVVNSADSVVISAFLGLYVLAQYQNYYYIFHQLLELLRLFYIVYGGYRKQSYYRKYNKKLYGFSKVIVYYCLDYRILLHMFSMFISTIYYNLAWKALAS